MCPGHEQLYERLHHSNHHLENENTSLYYVKRMMKNQNLNFRFLLCPFFIRQLIVIMKKCLTHSNNHNKMYMHA